MDLREKILTFYDKYMVIIGILGHSFFVFEDYEIIRAGSSQNLSLQGFIVTLLALLSWLIYGLLKKDRVLIIVNVVGAILSVSCITLILIYSHA